MGPKPATAKGKAQPTQYIPVVGAKFAWICVGSTNKKLSVLVNLNCTVDILLDYAKRIIMKKIDDEVISLKETLGESESPIESENANIESQRILHEQNQLTLDKMIEIQTILNTDGLIWDLCDPAGQPINCFENLKKTAFEDVLVPGTYYTMAKRLPPDEKGNISYFPFVFDVSLPTRKSPSKPKK